MTNRTPEDIEREIEAERAALAQSITALQQQFAPDALVDLAGDYLRRHGGHVAESVIRQVRANPVAASLAGAGLAWLASGAASAQAAPPVRTPPRAGPATPVYDTRESEPVSDFRHADHSLAGFDDRIAAVQTAADPSHPDPAITPAKGDTSPMTYQSDHHDTSEMTLTERITHGTEDLSEAARRRVIRAREAAHSASQAAAERAGAYAASGRDAFDSKPLVAGLIAFGIGAAIGASLPRTRQEDSTFGQYRDRAIAEAERIFAEEKEKLRAAATETLTEARKNMPTPEDVARNLETAAGTKPDTTSDLKTH
ncbi:MAG: DUF3618 domain-containing protein [Jannaschia sp.]